MGNQFARGHAAGRHRASETETGSGQSAVGARSSAIAAQHSPNMRAVLLTILFALVPALPAQPQPRSAGSTMGAPKLVVAICIDQFRYDYLTRFRSEYTGGLKRMLVEGANFTNSRYQHYQTVTAAGHSTFLSGATPSTSGIVGNEWWDRTAGAPVTSVSDGDTKLLGGTGAGSSPRRLLQSTVGDELKASGKG